MPGPITATRAARQQQVARDQDAAKRLTSAYLDTWARIKSDLAALQNEIASAQASGTQVPVSWLYREGRLQKLGAQVARDVDYYAQYAHASVQQEILTAAHQGAADAVDALNSTIPVGISYSFNRLPTAAINQLASGDGLQTSAGLRFRGAKELQKYYDSLAPDAAARAKRAIIQGVAVGDSPAKIAARLRDALSIPLSKALTISRTESLGAYRRASQETMRANADVMAGWKWLTGATPCPFCQEQAERGVIPMDEDFESHPNCFPAGVMVSGPRVLASSQRWYSGPLVEIETAGGHFLSVTPNHPILTPDGWAAAGELIEGGYVISRASADGVLGGIHPDKYQRPTLIEQVAATLGGSSSVTAIGVPGSAEDFHGDGCEC